MKKLTFVEFSKIWTIKIILIILQLIVWKEKKYIKKEKEKSKKKNKEREKWFMNFFKILILLKSKLNIPLFYKLYEKDKYKEVKKIIMKI